MNKSNTGRTNALSSLSRQILWAKAAGRCQYAGCNKSLIGDLIAGVEDKNFGFVAHIVADRPTGPRGDEARSALLSDDVRNLMLMCYTHHKLIDVDAVEGHPESLLIKMKADHEDRIQITTGIQEDRASHIVRYSANIGAREALVSFPSMSTAMLPTRYPAGGRNIIDLEIIGSAFQDHEDNYWALQKENLKRTFNSKIRDRIQSRNINHISVFALAPQPLLIELGRLLGDIVAVDIFQLHRDPKGWKWADKERSLNFVTTRPKSNIGPVALILSVSANITDDRITSILGNDTSIWKVSVPSPGNDVMRSRADLEEFRRVTNSILNEIKSVHGEQAVINVFPALPVSAAVELGRAWMPKADLPLVIYDQNSRAGGFIKTIEISHTH